MFAGASLDENSGAFCELKANFFRLILTKAEFCGLTVRDLDFKNEVIRIDHQLQRTRDMKYEIVSTKTTSGTRLLPMEEDVKDAFLRILKNRKKTKKSDCAKSAVAFYMFRISPAFAKSLP